MTRDWSLIRLILLKLEEKTNTTGAFPGYDTEAVSCHMHLLLQAGLIEAACKTHSGDAVVCLARNLTWAGHEFLDSIRSDTAWNRIGAVARDKGLDLSFDAIKQIASHVMRNLLG